MFGLGFACLVYPALSMAGPMVNLAGVAMIGILTYGADILMCGAAVQDIVNQQHTASAAGFVNGVGSVGQLVSPLVVLWITVHSGWDRLFLCLVAVAWAGGLLLATQWARPPLQVRLQTA
jgi:OPA family sugar phosphate sensor protein UhpC-like MFS transporter